jgi:hypothetical protein
MGEAESKSSSKYCAGACVDATVWRRDQLGLEIAHIHCTLLLAANTSIRAEGGNVFPNRARLSSTICLSWIQTTVLPPMKP